jgi:hypothetical protein
MLLIVCFNSGIIQEGSTLDLENCASPVRIIGPDRNSTGALVPGFLSTGQNILLVETNIHRLEKSFYF